jgi:putative MATE family efflux protein
MKAFEKRDLILNGDLKKTIIKLSLPLLLTNLSQTMYNLTDTFWLGKVGAEEVAASSVTWPILFLIITIGIGISTAGTSLMSQYMGNDDKENARIVAGQIFSLTIIFSIIMTIFGFIFAPKILGWMGVDGTLLEKASTYLRIMILGTPISYFYMIFNSTRVSQGNTVTPMIINICGVSLNMILDPIFILILNMGVTGAAIASVLSQGIFLSAVFVLLFKKNDGIYIILKNIKLIKKRVTKIFKIGIPSTIGTSMESMGFIVLNSFIVSYGSVTLAAFGIANRINSLVFMPGMAIGGAIVSIVGQNIGIGNVKRARKAFYTASLFSFIISITLGIILFIYSKELLQIFVPSPEDIEVVIQGSYYMRLMALSLFLVALNDLFIGTFQGSGHTIYSMILSMGRLWIYRIPLIMIFQKLTNWGSEGVWYAMVLSNLLTTITGLIFFLSGKWEKRVIEKK